MRRNSYLVFVFALLLALPACPRRGPAPEPEAPTYPQPPADELNDGLDNNHDNHDNDIPEIEPAPGAPPPQQQQPGYGGQTYGAQQQQPGNQPGHEQPGQDQRMAQAMCPTHVPGTTVQYEETDDGASLVFTTEVGDEEELRRRVRYVADMHNRHHQQREQEQPGAHQQIRSAIQVRSEAEMEEVDNGARLNFEPREDEQRQALRGEVQQQAVRMARGECSLLIGAHGAPHGPGAR